MLLLMVLGSLAPAELSALPPSVQYVDVRTYLPAGYVTNGSVDYKTQIQKCLDENLCVYFPGSNDPDKPMIYGISGATVGKILKTRDNARLRLGPNAIVKRVPSMGDMIQLGYGAQLHGMVLDGNKYEHKPLIRDRKPEPYAYVIGHAVLMGGRNLIEDCFVYNLAGIAFGSWGPGDNKIYRCRAEHCGFFEMMPTMTWTGEHAAGDGFFIYGGSRFNMVQDCEAINCARWGYVIEGRSSDNTFVDCRGGNLNYQSLGFFDVESAGPGNSLVRCTTINSRLTVQGYFQDVISCQATQYDGEHSDYLRLLDSTTLGGAVHVCEVQNDQVIIPGGASSMLAGNRIYLGGAGGEHSLSVIGRDSLGIAVNNTVFAVRERQAQSPAVLLFGVSVRAGNQEIFGQWRPTMNQFIQPYFLRAWLEPAQERRQQSPGTEVSP